jgi:iron complex outermembrane receptor protein
VFTREQLDRLGFDYLYELLSLVPGYQNTRGAENAYQYSFSARGRRSSGQAREILVVVDGRLLANPRSGAVDTTYPFIPLEQIERVEVIRGPGSAIYGSSAFNGVINIITRRGDNIARVGVGSDNRRMLSGSLSGQLGDGAEAWAGNLYARIYRDSGQDFVVRDTSSKLPITTSDPRQTLDLDGSLVRGDTTIRASFHRNRAQQFYVIENTENDFNGTEHALQQISLEQKFSIVDGVNTQFSAGYLVGTQDLHVLLASAALVGPVSNPRVNEPLLGIGKIRGENINLRLTNNWLVGDSANALWGMEWKREEDVYSDTYNNYDLLKFIAREFPVTYYGNFNHSVPLSRGDTFEAAGIYGQYQRDLNEATRVTLGARYDYHQYRGEHVSPRLGIVHQLSDTQSLKLLYGEAFRAPSLGETGVINNPLIVGNPDLDFELVRTWDAIWLANWNKTSVSIGAFRNVYQDPIIAGLIGTTRTYINGGDEHSDGIEIELQQHLGNNWFARVAYTDFLTLPDSAFREAQHLTGLELNYAEGRWNWNIAAWYQSERQSPGLAGLRNSLDSYWVVNSKLRYQVSPTLTLNVQCKNLADDQFRTPGQGVNLPEGAPNRGRELSLNLEWAL